MSKSKSLNISDVLHMLDKKDYGLYDRLDDIEKKELSAWVLMRFMSSCENNPEIYLLSINENVNDGFALLSPHHKKLLTLMLATCGVGSRQNHKWIAPPKGSKKAGDPLLDVLREMLPDKNNQELEIFKKAHTDDEMKDYLMMCGIEEKQIQAIFSE